MFDSKFVLHSEMLTCFRLFANKNNAVFIKVLKKSRKVQLGKGLEALPSDVEKCCPVVLLKTKILITNNNFFIEY